jgi:hypothetical protein
MFFLTTLTLSFGQFKAKFGDFEIKSRLFGKTSDFGIEGSRSIDVPLNGYAEVVLLCISDSDKMGFGINGNLSFYEITEVAKTNNYFIVTATYLKSSQAKFKFKISTGCRDIFINFGSDEFLLLLNSEHYYTEKFRTWVDVFQYLDEKY